MKKYLKKYIFVFLSFILLSLVFGAGLYIGSSRKTEIEKVLSLTHKETGTTTKADFSSFWKAWNVINEKSIYANKVTDQERVWGAVEGLASSLGDPYTVFFSPQENKLFNDTIHGSFGGIGAEIGIKDKILTVVSPLKDTPSWKAGIKSGDKILKIDKTETTNMTIDKALTLIRGEKGTTVTLVILHPGEKQTKELKIVRDVIQIPTIDTNLRPDGIFVISFYSFSENSAELFRQALVSFADSKSDKLIIDLRGNPGGYLDSAINIGSWFIDEGKTIVRESFGEKQKEQIYRSHGPKVFSDALKLVVLVDGGSASASEILAGALQENKIGKIVGEQTFGKGSVQELVEITPETSLKVTVAKWLTPNGISISEKGLTPDVVVPITMKDVETKNDAQMNKAVEILLSK